MRRFLGWSAIVLVLLGILVPVAALAFSVRVQGNSMEPTLHDGDRMLVQLWDRGRIERFDLVDAGFDQGAIRVVKRVIGMPGDQVAIAPVTGSAPVVLVRPAGSQEVFRVDNPAWEGRVGSRTNACCAPSGHVETAQTWATVPDGHYWLLGDNWGGSQDSREFGWVEADDITGRLDFRVRPLSRLGRVPNDVGLVPQP